MTHPLRHLARWSAAFGVSIIGAVLLALAGSPGTGGTLAQQPTEPDASPSVCADVRYLMARDISPYDLLDPTSAPVVAPNQTINRRFASGEYAHLYTLSITSPGTQITLRAGDIDAALTLEYSLFRGLARLGAGYRPLIANTVATQTVNETGLYTLVIRRTAIRDSDTPGSYTFIASYSGESPPQAPPLRDESISGFLDPTPQLRNGQQIIDLPSATVRLHPDSARSVASLNGRAAQLFLRGGGLLVDRWVSQVDLLGGDLVIRGAVDGNRRLLYVQDYDHRVDANNLALTLLPQPDGTNFQFTWEGVSGIWILRDCAGVRLSDGRTLIAPIAPERRRVAFTGDLNRFSAQVSAPAPAGSAPVSYSLSLAWQGIADESEVQWVGGVLSARFAGGYDLRLAGRVIDIEPLAGAGIAGLSARVQATPDAPAKRVVLDWVNLRRVALVNDALTLTFDDARATVTRSASDLRLFEALQDVIRLVYGDTGGGEERLILPASDSYLEIITPPGDPPFDSLALPPAPGYMPRALNNLGGECYPVNTLLPEANCPPNGHPNPANGNLWLSITDLTAPGDPLGLWLTRSYNSAQPNHDGAFGRGWATAFQLDYDAPYNPETASRIVTPDTPRKPALDVTWAPRGIVTYRTASGSLALFMRDETASGNAGSGEQYRALNLPGWSLSRVDRRAPWTLTQPGDLIHTFDRAGRPLGYSDAYDTSAQVTITFDRARLDGLANSEAIISDAPTRHMHLLYDAHGRIQRAILRDTTLTSAGDPCRPADNCYTVEYEYDAAGRLMAVRYADGSEGRYTYDNGGRLIAHDDPRAPIAPQMRYTYAANELISAAIRNPDGTETAWRALSLAEISPTTRTVTVTDEWGRVRRYTYALSGNTPLRSAGAGYTLISVSSPLAELDTLDSLPQAYTWADGLLTQINARVARALGGRNSTSIAYQDGRIRAISGGALGIDITYNADGQPLTARFADGTRITYTYGDNGLPDTRTDRDGARYSLTWFQGRLVRQLRVNDGMTWRFSYDNAGRLTRVDRNGYVISYEYDGLGRLVSAADSLGESYRIAYLSGGELGAGLSAIRITDAIGGVTQIVLDPLGRLIERTLTDINGDILRREQFTYHPGGELATRTVWADADTPLTDRYRIEQRDLLPAQPGDTVQRPIINGYSVIHTDAYGRTATRTYDALDRLRQVEDSFQRVTRYDYLYTSTLQTNGLRIVQRDIRGSQLIATTTYQFDPAWQLRAVSQAREDDPTLTWDFNTQGDAVRYQFMEARQSGIRTLAWLNNEHAQPTSLRLTLEASPLDTPDPRPALTLEHLTDFAGRPTRHIDPAGNVRAFAYCPLRDGGERVLVGVLNGDALTFDCHATAYDQAWTLDATGRPVRVEYGDGTPTRRYSTRNDPLAGVRIVTVDYGGGITWELRYNAAGDLVAWTDEAGIVRRYGYDWAGRLVAVDVSDNPSASVQYTYNAAGLLVREVDGLGRGTLYQYDGRGLLTVQQDILTADAITYAYSPFGELISRISPLGNTTAYLYADPADPSRLTGVIDATGVEDRLIWDTATNSLLYRDIRSNETRYWFDPFGTLWRIDDALGQRHDLRYDAGGHLRQWTSAGARRLDLSAPSGGRVRVSAPGVSDGWALELVFGAGGQLAGVDLPWGAGLTIERDPLGRLARLAADERTWTVTRTPGEPSLMLDDTRLTFDSQNRLRAVDDLNDGERPLARYTYTPTGRRGDLLLTIETDAERSVLFSPGDSSSRPRTVTLSAPGQTLTYLYDAEGRIESIQISVCLAGNAVCEPGDRQSWTGTARFVYDALGRPFRIIDEEQNIETFTYDEAGNLSAYQSAKGRTFSYAYDALNRLTAITSTTGIKLLLNYDRLGNLTGLCRTRLEAPNDYSECASINGELLTLAHDPLGRVTGYSYPNAGAPGGTTTLSHRYEGGLLTGWRYASDAEDSVTLSYSADALALLSAVAWRAADGDAQLATLSYDAAGRLAQATGTGGARYTYDHWGRVIGVERSNRALVLDYLTGRGGVRLSDPTTGAELTYQLDERGFLSALIYAGALNGNDLLLTARYLPDPRETGRLSILLTADDNRITRDSQVNRRGDTQNLVLNYDTQRLLIDYVTNPAGQISRQRMDGTPFTFFVDDAQGYIQVIGYNDDDRLSTIRINAKSDGALLYVLNFTYNDAGLRSTETRRYADNTLVNVRYDYDNPSQLTRRTVSITRPPAPGAPTPTRQEVYVYEYRYDRAGNLARIDYVAETAPEGDNLRPCAVFAYDSLNRLTSATFGERQYVYTYDIHNRLTRINNLTLIYNGRMPVVAFTPAGDATYYGAVGEESVLFFADDGGVSWLIGDGRDRLLNVWRDTPDEPLLLLDPLGRPILLGSPPAREAINPCDLMPVESSLLTLTPPLPSFAGMLWQAQANLYFRDGRAYLPEIGRFLQRDPLGADINGGVYEYSSREPAPVFRHDDPALFDGLRTLQDAIIAAHGAEALSAEAVKTRALPPMSGIVGQAHWAEALGVIAPNRTGLQSLLDLPLWLNGGYNLSGAQVVAGDNTLRLDGRPAPGQGYLPAGDRYRLPHGLALTPFSLPVEDMARLGDAARVAFSARPFRDYQPWAWRADAPALAAAWSVPVNVPAHQPGAGTLLAHLVYPLSAPQDANATLDLLARIERLPHISGAQWVEELLSADLPTVPDLPPLTAADLRATWLDNDTLGIGRVLGRRWGVPPAPHAPLMPFGRNDAWLLP